LCITSLGETPRCWRYFKTGKFAAKAAKKSARVGLEYAGAIVALLRCSRHGICRRDFITIFNPFPGGHLFRDEFQRRKRIFDLSKVEEAKGLSRLQKEFDLMETRLVWVLDQASKHCIGKLTVVVGKSMASWAAASPVIPAASS
jgi:hypothetical protein